MGGKGGSQNILLTCRYVRKGGGGKKGKSSGMGKSVWAENRSRRGEKGKAEEKDG